MASKPLLLRVRSGPPVLWRTARWCLLLACISAVSAVSLAIVRAQWSPPRPPWIRYSIMAFGFAPVALIFPVGHLVQRRVKRDWRRSSGWICPHCGYCVTGLEGAGTCPECGSAYDIERDAELWSQAGLVRERADGGAGPQNCGRDPERGADAHRS